MLKMERPRLACAAHPGVLATGLDAPLIAPPARKSQAQQLLDILAPDGERTFQTFGEGANDHPSLRRVIHGPRFQELRRISNAGGAIFWMPNRGDGRGRKNENVIEVRNVFADFDDADPAPAIAALPPHAVVESSPGKFHCYWRVRDLPLPMFAIVQKAIAMRWGSDPVVCDLCRVMRMVGSWHRKGAVPFRVRLVSISDHAPYALAEIVEAMGLELPKPNANHGSFLQPTPDLHSRYAEAALDRAAHAIVSAPNGAQNFTLNRECFSIGQLSAAGMIPEGMAKQTLAAAAARMVDYDQRRPWHPAQINRLIARSFAAGARKPRAL